MDLAIFSAAFIIQFVGHRVGDYFFQTDYQAQNKSKNAWARLKHCFIYALTISLLMALAFEWRTLVVVFVLTIIEHFIIDSRTPVTGWKKTLERMVGNKDFDIDKMPFFVLIEIDQTIHYTRCLIIAVLIAYEIM